MTARDEAADAIYQLLGCICKQDGEECRSCHDDAEGYVDAIPDGVLVRLAIERGALEPAGLDPHTDVQLYRLVDP